MPLRSPGRVVRRGAVTRQRDHAHRDAERDGEHHERGQARIAPETGEREPQVVGEHFRLPPWRYPARPRVGMRAGGVGMRFVGLEIRDLAVDHLHVAVRAAGELRIVRDHDDGGAHLVDLLEQVHDLACHQ